MPDYAGLPTDASLHKEVASIRPVSKDLHVLDVGDPRNLCDGVLQKAWHGARFVDNSREGRERALIAKSFFRVKHEHASLGDQRLASMQSSGVAGGVAMVAEERS